MSQLRGRQPAGEFSANKIKRLKRDMQADGFDDAFPIEIAEVDGRRIIIDGHHRARAAGAAGITDLPVRTLTVTPEPGDMLLEQAAEAAENLGLPFRGRRMKPSELVLDRDEREAIGIIPVFLDRQRTLVGRLREDLGGEIDRFSWRKQAPKVIDALDATWAVVVHGVGIRFANTETGEVIDVHVGLFDAPGAFDGWRMEQYAESIHSDLRDFGSILERLASEGVISRHPSLANHYEWPNSFATEGPG